MSWFNTLRRKKSGGTVMDYFKDMTLDEFLAEAGLLEWATLFRENGVNNVGDLDLLEDSDLEGMGMKMIQCRRFRKEFARWVVAEQNGVMRPEAAGPVGAGQATTPDSSRDAADLAEMLHDLNTEAQPAGGSGPRPLPAVPPSDVDHDYVDPDEGAYENTLHLPPSHPIHTAATINSNPDPATHLSYSHLPEEDEEVAVTVGDDMYEMPDTALASRSRELDRRRSTLLQQMPEDVPLPQNPRDWTNGEILRWLKEQDLDDFKDIFYSNGFSGKQLVALVADHFSRGGFSKERCGQLGAAIDKLKKSTRDAPRMPAATTPSPAAVALPAAAASAHDKVMCRAIADFTGTKPKHLSIKAYQEFEVLDSSKDWWTVVDASGNQGTVPRNYVEVIPAAPPRRSTVARPPAQVPNAGPPVDMRRHTVSPGGAGGMSAIDKARARLSSGSGKPEWLHDDINDRVTAERRLNGRPRGSFLIRRGSGDPRSYTLSMNGESGVVHLKIDYDAGSRQYILGKSSSGMFVSLDELVQFYSTNEIRVQGKERVTLMIPCPRS